MLKTVGNPSTRFGDQTIDNGNLVIATPGKGIDFSATGQAPGMTSELLTDYEEGNWTPSYVPKNGAFGSISYAAGGTDARYTKIGRIVFVYGCIQTTGITVGTASGDVYLAGLPFASLTAGGYAVNYQNIYIGAADSFGANTPLLATIGDNATTALLQYRATANGPTSNLQVSDLDTGIFKNLIRFSGFYIV